MNTTYLDGLKAAATQLANYRHHANTPQGTEKSWWLAWDAIASMIDIERCSDCSPVGTITKDQDRTTYCDHPKVEKWATA